MLTTDLGFVVYLIGCIKNIYVWNNTSIVVDEVLSHRFGPRTAHGSVVDGYEEKYVVLFFFV